MLQMESPTRALWTMRNKCRVRYARLTSRSLIIVLLHLPCNSTNRRKNPDVTIQLLRRQDLKVDEMQRGTQRLGEMAGAINVELEAQGEALDELGNDIDSVNDRMEAVIVKMEELLQTKNRCSLGFIVFLVIVMFILLCLVIWT